MDKKGNITISYDTWKDGIKSPLLGMGDMVNVDMVSKPGILKIDYAPDSLAVTEFTDDPATAIFEPGDDQVHIFAKDGEYYRYTDSGVLALDTQGSNGIDNGVYWKGLFVVTRTGLGSLTLNAYLGGWANAFDSVSGDQNFNAIHTSPADNDLYVGAGRYIARFSENTDFDPTDGATYTKVDKFLTLPEDYVVQDITTLANFIVVSASIEPEFENDIPPYGARLYYWDMSQTATVAQEWTGFVDLATSVASPIKTSNNAVYYFDWEKNSWGVTNLSSTTDLFYLDNIEDRLRGFAECSAFVGRQFLLGLSSYATTETPAGIYKIFGDSYTRNTLSNGETGENGDVEIFFITPLVENKYVVGWTTGGDTYGVDAFAGSGYRYTGYKAYIESPLYQPGLVLNDKSYQQFEITLAKGLATGQGFKLYYRENLSDDWTEANYELEPNFTNYGAVSKINGKCGIGDATTVQFKVEMTTGEESSTTPELISVKIF